MFGAIANRTAFIGRQAIAARFFALVGTQVPSVVLHSLVTIKDLRCFSSHPCVILLLCHVYILV
jgi:hypothetical protein